MIITVLSIAAILYLALQLEDKFKIPSPVGLIALSFCFHLFFGGLFMFACCCWTFCGAGYSVAAYPAYWRLSGVEGG